MLGIVYTPVEIVDFIIKSVNEIVLQSEFGLIVEVHRGFILLILSLARVLSLLDYCNPDILLTRRSRAQSILNEIHANEIVYYLHTTLQQ